MREILFRGKRTTDGEWCEGNLFIDEKGEKHEILLGYTNYHIAWEVIPSTIGQFTGLTDKNNKKIFEGDIVKFNKHIYQIVFEVGSFALLDKDGEIISKIGGINDHCYPLMELYLECCWEDDWAYDIEVIGNIHDNSEFLRSGS